MVSPDEWLEEVNKAVSNGFNLTGWESDFIESISERLDEGRDLTSAQEEKLEEIWNKARRFL